MPGAFIVNFQLILHFILLYSKKWITINLTINLFSDNKFVFSDCENSCMSQENLFGYMFSSEKKLVSNYIFSDPTSIYLLKCSDKNSRIKCKICSKLIIEARDTILMCLLLIRNIFNTFLVFFLLSLNM